ncbi:solute carrier family 43 member 3, partial [Trichonephila clavata]
MSRQRGQTSIELRKLIIKPTENGKSVREISEIVKSHSTVHDIIKRYKTNNQVENTVIADLFPERRSTVITLYSGAFSASASVFVFIKYGFDAGLPWEWACFLLVVLSALMLPVTLFVLPANRFGQEKGGLFTGKEKEVSSVAPCVWGTYTYIGDGPNFH